MATLTTTAYGSHVTPIFSGGSALSALTHSEAKLQRLMGKLQDVVEEHQASAIKAQEAYAAKLAAIQSSLATIEKQLNVVKTENMILKKAAQRAEVTLRETIDDLQARLKASEERETWMKSVINNYVLLNRSHDSSIGLSGHPRAIFQHRLQLKQEALKRGIIL